MWIWKWLCKVTGANDIYYQLLHLYYEIMDTATANYVQQWVNSPVI